MKQTITIEQLNELSEKGKERLREWIESKLSPPISGSAYIGPLSSPYQTCYFMTIGQMFEFLSEKGNYKENTYIDDEFKYVGWFNSKSENGCIGWTNYTGKTQELCDALWESVKEILEEDDKR